jgi:hypothetical protein
MTGFEKDNGAGIFTPEDKVLGVKDKVLGGGGYVNFKTFDGVAVDDMATNIASGISGTAPVLPSKPGKIKR